MFESIKDALPAVILVASLITIYIASYLLNKKTPIPEECLDNLDEATCSACNITSCSHKT